jgi:hypothetical protein
MVWVYQSWKSYGPATSSPPGGAIRLQLRRVHHRPTEIAKQLIRRGLAKRGRTA